MVNCLKQDNPLNPQPPISPLIRGAGTGFIGFSGVGVGRDEMRFSLMRLIAMLALAFITSAAMAQGDRGPPESGFYPAVGTEYPNSHQCF